MNLMESELNTTCQFLYKIPDIGEIAESDQRLLILQNFFPLFVIKQTFQWVELK